MDFNPDELMHSSMNKASSTSIIPVPVGDWEATLGKPIFRQNAITKGERIGEMVTFMDIACVVDDPQVLEICHRERPSVRHSMFITLTPDGTGISDEEGDNIDFGRLRDACGLNEENMDFTPAMFEGQRVLIRVKHDPNSDDPENPYARVASIRKI
jgi:hypothetical protein